MSTRVTQVGYDETQHTFEAEGAPVSPISVAGAFVKVGLGVNGNKSCLRIVDGALLRIC